VDRLINIERLQFADTAVILDRLLPRTMPTGCSRSATHADGGQLLTVSAAGVTDLDNVSADNPTGAITGRSPTSGRSS
jgi:hypothetical protein